MLLIVNPPPPTAGCSSCFHGKACIVEEAVSAHLFTLAHTLQDARKDFAPSLTFQKIVRNVYRIEHL